LDGRAAIGGRSSQKLVHNRTTGSDIRDEPAASRSPVEYAAALSKRARRVSFRRHPVPLRD
jgi:hypothetical protein